MQVAALIHKVLPATLLAGFLFTSGVASAQTPTVDWSRTYAKGAFGTNVGSWVKRDGSGNVLMAGTTSFGGGTQVFVRKYTAEGVLLWTTTAAAANEEQVLTGMVVDGGGNAILSGWSAPPATTPKWMVLKITSGGVLSWTRSSISGKANGIAVADGQAVVTGWATSAVNGADIYTVKYDVDGSELWHARNNGTANDDDQGAAVSIDGSRNVYVAATAESSTGETQLRTIKYSSSGGRIWLKFFVGPGSIAEASHIAAFQNGGCVVLGRMWDGADPASGNLTLTCYFPNGDVRWRKYYDGAKGLNDVPMGLASNDLGNIAVIAHSFEPGGLGQMATLNYNSSGVLVWSRRLDDALGIKPTGVAIDNELSLIVSGTVGSGVDSDLLAVKYLSNGNRKWTYRFDGIAGGADGGNGVVVDPSLNAYVVGSTETSWGTLIEALLIKMH